MTGAEIRLPAPPSVAAVGLGPDPCQPIGDYLQQLVKASSVNDLRRRAGPLRKGVLAT